MDHNLIIEKTLTVFIECKVESFPIDCFHIFSHYGYKAYTYQKFQQSNQRLFTMCKNYSNDAFRYRDTICYNQNIPFSRIRFSLMHELGHILLQHTGETQANENEADYFASNLLAPRIVIQRRNCRTADDIHHTFGLSFSASNRILSDYQQWKRKRISHTDKKISEWFYPQKDISKLPNKPDRKKPGYSEADKYIDFILDYERNDYFFRIAEDLKLYGNDL